MEYREKEKGKHQGKAATAEEGGKHERTKTKRKMVEREEKEKGKCQGKEAAAEEGVKQPRKKKRNEVFPFGNYRSYYGYRVIFFLVIPLSFST